MRPYAPPVLQVHDRRLPSASTLFTVTEAPAPPPAAELGRYAIAPAGAVRRGGAHRLRAWTTRRAGALVVSSCVLAVCGGGLGTTLSAPPDADRAPRVVALLPDPTGTAPAPAPSADVPSAAPSPSGGGRPSTAPTGARPRPTATRPPAAAGRPVAPGAPSTGPSAPAAPTTDRPPSGSPVPVLRYGDSGPQVRRLQNLLLDLACAPPRYRTVTGTFDDWTRAVLTSFQRSAGVRGEDGAYGPASRVALEAAVPRC
ncbi:peptidoglycan-binding protein [Kitasatospora sp. NPDC088391]|uniref:peptidoglycan-binding protein n=1 Tax=Kitasatospora sp. NPDC088391 TaxID=3364074 RepID=UPI0037FF9311